MNKDIQVGDRITYDSYGEIVTTLVLTKQHIEELQEAINSGDILILKIERPKYELIEEKKELLTEEEREFLKNYIRLLDTTNNVEFIVKSSTYIYVYMKDSDFYRADIEGQFNNLEENEEYTLSELRIGGLVYGIKRSYKNIKRKTRCT